MTGLANPSAVIGLSAINGAALTAMSSDSAPRLSQSIIPTWTGLHTFSAGLTVSGGTVTIGTHTLTLSANATVGGTNTGDQIIPASANPTAKVGTTAINGVASTFMTSDSAPAIDLTFAPTWTGTHTFSKNVVINGTTTALAVNGAASAFTGFFTASSSVNNSLGVLIRGGTTANDEALLVQNQSGSVSFMEFFGDGHGFLGASSSAGVSWNTAGAMTFSAAVQAPTVTLTTATPTVSAGQVGLGVTTTTTIASTIGGVTLVGLLAAGCLEVNIGGTMFAIPYFAL